MIYTEEQAIDIVCVRAIGADKIPVIVGDGNIVAAIRQYCSCADNGASRCSAWRWWDAATPDVGRWDGLQWKSNVNRRGYCGLAGKPENGE